VGITEYCYHDAYDKDGHSHFSEFSAYGVDSTEVNIEAAAVEPHFCCR
jgi:hypothetical protein